MKIKKLISHFRRGFIYETQLQKGLINQTPTKIIILVIIFLFLSTSPARAGELANQFTAEIWVKPTAVDSRALMVKNNEIRLVTDASGNPLCQIYAAGSWQTAATSSTALTTGTWQHVACSYDLSTLRVYVNGVATGTQSLSVRLDDSSSNFRIGNDESGTYSDFTGTVDEYRIYNYARTPAQILQDMRITASSVRGSAGGIPEPIAHWAFDEQAGQTVHDKVGGNDGTRGADANAGSDDPTWTTSGKRGGALSFDGGDKVITSDEAAVRMDQSKSMTFSAWVKPNSISNGNILRYDDNDLTDGDWSSSRNLYLFRVNNDGSLHFTFGPSSGLTTVSGGSLQSGTWYHVTAVRDVVGDIAKIYVNGEQVASTTDITTGTWETTGQYLMFGAYSSTEYFDGLIDEVKIYNTALTPDQIKQDMNAGVVILGDQNEAEDLSDGAGSAPVYHFPFDEKSGTSKIYDHSNNNVTATIVGSMTESDWVTGKYGSALEFDGIDDLVYAPSTHLSLTSGTVTAWVKPWSETSDGFVFSHYKWPGKNRIYIFLSNGEFEISLGTDWFSSGVYPTPNEWGHLAITWDNGVGKAYLNGKKVIEENYTGLDSKNTEFSLGGFKYNDDMNSWVEAAIDEVKIYDYARTPAQIAYDYNRGKPIAHYRFDECEGTTIHDVSGNGYDGTLTIGVADEDTVGTCNTSSTAWGSGTTGKYSASVDLDGSDDFIDVGTGPTAVNTVSFWVKPARTTEYLVDLNGTAYISAGSGTLSATGFTSPTIYVNGIVSSTLTAGVWQHVTVVTDTALNASDFDIGRVEGFGYLDGQIDDVQIFNYALSAEQVKKLYNQNSAIRFE